MDTYGVKGYEVYDRVGNFVRMFPTQSEVGRYVGVSRQYIRQVVSDDHPYSRTAKGFTIKKIMNTIDDAAKLDVAAAERRYNGRSKSNKQIRGTRVTDGETIMFRNPASAAEFFGTISSANIIMAANAVYRDGRPLVAYGHTWDYVED